MRNSIKYLRESKKDIDTQALENQIKVIEEEISKLQRKIDRFVDRIANTNDETLIPEYEKKIRTISGYIKSLERSKNEVQDQLDSVSAVSHMIEDADNLVSKIQKASQKLVELTFEKKCEIIEKIYPPGSIWFYPKWFLEILKHHPPEVKEPIKWDFETFLNERGMKIRAGVLVCSGYLDWSLNLLGRKPSSIYGSL